MKVAFHPDAEAELNAAVDYYESCEPGLGLAFALEASLALDRAEQYPIAWAPLDDVFRRSLLRRFPYGLIYTLRNDELLVMAVMNLYREPDYWKQR